MIYVLLALFVRQRPFASRLSLLERTHVLRSRYLCSQLGFEKLPAGAFGFRLITPESQRLSPKPELGDGGAVCAGVELSNEKLHARPGAAGGFDSLCLGKAGRAPQLPCVWQSPETIRL